MDDIEAGIDIGRHASASGIQDGAAGRRRFNVPGTDRGGGINDHDRQSLFRRQAADFGLGEKLGPFVVADHVEERGRGVFVGGATVGVYAERCDAARIHDSADPRLGGGEQQVSGTGDIAGVDFLRVRGPKTVIGRNVEECSAARDGLFQRGRIAEIACHHLDVQPLDISLEASWARQYANRMTRVQKAAEHGRPDEAGRTGDEGGHCAWCGVRCNAKNCLTTSPAAIGAPRAAAARNGTRALENVTTGNKYRMSSVSNPPQPGCLVSAFP